MTQPYRKQLRKRIRTLGNLGLKVDHFLAPLTLTYAGNYAPMGSP